MVWGLGNEDKSRIMNRQKDYAAVNKEWWEQMVRENCGFTQPWLDLDPATVQRLAHGQLKKAPEPLNQLYPIRILANIDGKDVLCLASGGGQQSAVFGLLGARVTVVDIADGQLAGDQQAADHYGYEIKTIQADMSDLSVVSDNSFDLVYQAPSMAYIPDVKPVYSEVARIIVPGGLYRVDAQNPLSFSVDEKSWDGKGYRISELYSVKEQRRSERESVIEFRHYLSDVFNGLIECGFMIDHVQEMPSDLYQNGKPEPGSWEHSLLYNPCSFTILARKR